MVRASPRGTRCSAGTRQGVARAERDHTRREMVLKVLGHRPRPPAGTQGGYAVCATARSAPTQFKFEDPTHLRTGHPRRRPALSAGGNGTRLALRPSPRRSGRDREVGSQRGRPRVARVRVAAHRGARRPCSACLRIRRLIELDGSGMVRGAVPARRHRCRRHVHHRDVLLRTRRLRDGQSRRRVRARPTYRVGAGGRTGASRGERRRRTSGGTTGGSTLSCPTAATPSSPRSTTARVRRMMSARSWTTAPSGSRR